MLSVTKIDSQNSWSLSSITHGEYTWQTAFARSHDMIPGHNLISTDDMRKDASRVRLHRFLMK